MITAFCGLPGNVNTRLDVVGGEVTWKANAPGYFFITFVNANARDIIRNFYDKVYVIRVRDAFFYGIAETLVADNDYGGIKYTIKGYSPLRILDRRVVTLRGDVTGKADEVVKTLINSAMRFGESWSDIGVVVEQPIGIGKDVTVNVSWRGTIMSAIDDMIASSGIMLVEKHSSDGVFIRTLLRDAAGAGIKRTISVAGMSSSRVSVTVNRERVINTVYGVGRKLDNETAIEVGPIFNESVSTLSRHESYYQDGSESDVDTLLEKMSLEFSENVVNVSVYGVTGSYLMPGDLVAADTPLGKFTCIVTDTTVGFDETADYTLEVIE